MNPKAVLLNGYVTILYSQIEHAAWASFHKKMKDKHYYSWEATRDAWIWFLAGWTGHIKGPRHIKG